MTPLSPVTKENVQLNMKDFGHPSVKPSVKRDYTNSFRCRIVNPDFYTNSYRQKQSYVPNGMYELTTIDY